MSAIEFDNESKFHFALSKSTNEIGIMKICGDERRAFFMTENQFHQMVDFIKTEMPSWIEKIKSLQEQSL